jgi:microcystin-dependent protein
MDEAMRNLKLLVLGLLTLLASFSAAMAQTTCPDPLPLKPSPSQPVACVVAMKSEIAALKAVEPPKAVAIPNGAIVMTDQECATLGSNWSKFTAARGRFPIAAGASQDINNVKMQFVVGHEDSRGEYAHKLIDAEMPKHNHSQPPFVYLLKRDGKGTTVRVDTTATQPNVAAGGHAAIITAGGNLPHNNLPPYIALNFCKKG